MSEQPALKSQIEELQAYIRTFTLDTNCILAVDEGRPEANAVRALADAHASGAANVAVVAISASERQRVKPIENFAQFRERLAALDLGYLEIIPAMFYWDIAFWDNCLWVDDDTWVRLEKNIHDVLFPCVEFSWDAFCEAQGLPPDSQGIPRKWRNAKCDVQALWAHIHHHRDVFVTTDGNFHKAPKKAALISLGANEILTPYMAATLVSP